MRNVKCVDGVVEVSDEEFAFLDSNEDWAPCTVAILNLLCKFAGSEDKLAFVKSIEPGVFLPFFAMARRLNDKTLSGMCENYFNFVLAEGPVADIEKYLNFKSDFTDDEKTSLAAAYDWHNVK
jgi:hypothetical protein